jgi:hypothetical protein
MAEWSVHMDAIREELARIRTDITGLRTELREDIAVQNSDTRRELDRLLASDRDQAVQIARLEVQATLWGGLGGLIATAVALGVALITRLLG